MVIRKSLYVAATLVALLALIGIATTFVAAERPSSVVDDDDDALDDGDADDAALDDGRALLPQAKLTFADAEAAARNAVPGEVEEVDLESVDGKLVFDVDMGSKTVRVDALNGTVLEITDKDPARDDD